MINPISKTNSFHAKEKLLREKKKTERKKKKGSEYQKLIAKVSEHQSIGAETTSPGASKFENFILLLQLVFELKRLEPPFGI